MSTFGKSLKIEEQDGSPSVSQVTKIKVGNGSLTNNGSGSVSIATSGSTSGTFLIDQTTPQTVTGGTPIFQEGLNSNENVTIKSGKKLYFDGI